MAKRGGVILCVKWTNSVMNKCQSQQANLAWFTSTSTRETIENEFITFEIYLDAKERAIFSLYDWDYSIKYSIQYTGLCVICVKW